MIRMQGEIAPPKRGFPRKAIIVVLLLAALASGLAYAYATHIMPTVNIRYDNGIVEMEIFSQINGIRLQHGLAPLRWSSELASYARYHAQEMLETDDAWHDTPYLNMRNWGEIAFYSAGRRVATESAIAADAVQGWMDSPAHRAIILRDAITDAGAGFAYAGTELACSFEVR